MSVSTYGVVLSMIEAELRGSVLTSIATDVERWILQYASMADTFIRQQGYVPSEIDALGSDDSLYNLAQLYVINGVAAKVARSGAMQDVSLAESLDVERELVERRILATPQAVSETTSRREDVRGGVLTSLDSATAPKRTPGTFWRPNMKW